MLEFRQTPTFTQQATKEGNPCLPSATVYMSHGLTENGAGV
jgi:hypothetical protein